MNAPQVYVHGLRSVLGRDRIVLRGHGSEQLDRALAAGERLGLDDAIGQALGALRPPRRVAII